MVSKIFLALIFIFHVSACLKAEPFNDLNKNWNIKSQEAPPKIKVLIAHDQPNLLLEITDKYIILDPHLKTLISTRFKGKTQKIEAKRGGLKWGEEFPGVHQLAFVPGSSMTKIIVNNVPYSGNIYIYDIGGTISAVNEISIEEYLASIMVKITTQPMTDEALAALAIASRTLAYHQVKNPKSNFWDVDASQADFKGINNVPLALQIALKKTRFMVLSLNGKLSESAATFPTKWEATQTADSLKAARSKALLAKISIAEANELASKGQNAAHILEKAFPQASIQLIHFESKQ
jgi:stage II sporulation protein D